MTVDDKQCFGPRVVAGGKPQPVYSPATPFFAVATYRNAAANRLQQ
jgi:hypothetical protein